MPRRSNKYPGIKQLGSGRWFARAYYQRKEYSREFSTQGSALKWRDKLLSDLKEAPPFVSFEGGQWWASVPTPTGEESFSSPVLEHVVAWHNNTRAQVSSGNWMDPAVREMTLKDLIRLWRAEKIGVSGKTMAGYNSLLRKHISKLEESNLISLKPRTIQEWVGDLNESGTGPVAIRAAYRLLHNVLEVAVSHGFLPSNPVTGGKLPAKKTKKMRALSREELYKLAEACGEFSTLVKFAGHCGLRMGEITALRVRHFNSFRGEVRVEDAWSTDESGKRVLSDPKTRKVRTVPVPREIMREIAGLTAKKGPEEFVFTGLLGSPLNDGYFRKSVWLPAVKIAGLSGVRFHDLRHTAASMLIRIGTPIVVVSQILGHSSTKMTLDVYGHYYEGDAARWMQALEDQFLPAAQSRTEQERTSRSVRAVS